MSASGLLPRVALADAVAARTAPGILFLVDLRPVAGDDLRPIRPELWRHVGRTVAGVLPAATLFEYGGTLAAGIADDEPVEILEMVCDRLRAASSHWPRSFAPALGATRFEPGEASEAIVGRSDRALGHAIGTGRSVATDAPDDSPPGDELAGLFTGSAAIDHGRVRLLAEALSIAASGRSLEGVLGSVVDLLIAATGADRGVLLVGGGGASEVRLARDDQGQPIDRLEGYSRSIPLEVQESGRGRLMVVDDEAAELPASVVRNALRSILCVPLDDDGRTIGVLYLDSVARGPVFGPDDLALAHALARRLGPAIRTLVERDGERHRERSAREALAAENRRLHRTIAGDLIAASPAMIEVLRRAEKVAATDSTVLITGESGTGKERVARLVHEASARRDRPLVVVNCAAIPRQLLESELFGHARGAFTGATGARTGKFEEADGGTLFLDEIGELPLELQPKILRALQEGEIEPVGGGGPRRVDVRILAATHRDLERMTREGGFREDLYFRLEVIPIHVPSLRERRQDIPPLFDSFLARIAARLGRPAPAVGADVRSVVEGHPWPGNVRQLANAVERAVVLCEGDAIDVADLGLARPPGAAAPPAGPRIPVTFREAGRQAIADALEAAGGNKTEAARLLGIPRSSLYDKLRELGLDADG